MDFPVFGQNPAALQVASASVPPAAPTAPQSGQQVAGSQTADASANQSGARQSAPSGFLDLVRATQHQYTDPNHKPQSFEKALFGEDGFGIDDVIAAINPLQQLPIISTIYRAITGDTIDVGPRLVGGAIYGGILGFVSAAVDAAVEGSTGQDIGGNVMSALFGAPDKPDNAPREPVMFSKADDNASQQADSSSPSSATSTASSAFGTPWYLANIVPSENSPQDLPKNSRDQNSTTALAGAAASPAIASAASATTAPQTQQALLQAASVASANNSGTNTPGSRPLTPAQQALLNERNDNQNVAAVAPAAGPPSKTIELSPEQEKLLLQSVGLAPKASDTFQPPVNQQLGNQPLGNQISANPAPAIVSSPAALATPAAPADNITPQSVESNTVVDSAAKAVGTTPVAPGPILHAGGLKPAGELASHPNGMFAQRMKYGIDKYLANPMPINTQPPHLDVIQ